MKAAIETMNPSAEANFNGSVEKEVMPSNAKRIIFL